MTCMHIHAVKKSIDTLLNFIEASMIIGYFVGYVNNSQN